MSSTKVGSLDFMQSQVSHLICYTGGPSLLDLLKADATLMANPSAKQGISDMDILFTLL
jgi:histidyl-tRNA synthetase